MATGHGTSSVVVECPVTALLTGTPLPVPVLQMSQPTPCLLRSVLAPAQP